MTPDENELEAILDRFDLDYLSYNAQKDLRNKLLAWKRKAVDEQRDAEPDELAASLRLSQLEKDYNSLLTDYQNAYAAGVALRERFDRLKLVVEAIAVLLNQYSCQTTKLEDGKGLK